MGHTHVDRWDTQLPIISHPCSCDCHWLWLAPRFHNLWLKWSWPLVKRSQWMPPACSCTHITTWHPGDLALGARKSTIQLFGYPTFVYTQGQEGLNFYVDKKRMNKAVFVVNCWCFELVWILWLDTFDVFWHPHAPMILGHVGSYWVNVQWKLWEIDERLVTWQLYHMTWQIYHGIPNFMVIWWYMSWQIP